MTEFRIEVIREAVHMSSWWNNGEEIGSVELAPLAVKTSEGYSERHHRPTCSLQTDCRDWRQPEHRHPSGRHRCEHRQSTDSYCFKPGTPKGSPPSATRPMLILEYHGPRLKRLKDILFPLVRGHLGVECGEQVAGVIARHGAVGAKVSVRWLISGQGTPNCVRTRRFSRRSSVRCLVLAALVMPLFHRE